jgi:hypothetical protein
MKQWDQIVRERFILRRIPDHQGRPMYTEERLFTYLQQFERDFAKSGRTIIDATEGGAAKRGAAPMRLADAMARYCREAIYVDIGDHPGPDWSRLGEVVECLRRRKDEAGRIERISRETLPLLEEVRDHVQDQERVNRAIARIDALRAAMNDFAGAYDLIAQLTQRSQLDRFEADRRIAGSKVDGVQRQRRQVARDVANVRSMMEAARRFQQLMDEVLESLAARS